MCCVRVVDRVAYLASPTEVVVSFDIDVAWPIVLIVVVLVGAAAGAGFILGLVWGQR